MENSKCGSIPMQEKLKLSKSQSASTPGELKCIQNVSYALAVGSIMYDVRCTHPDVAFAQNITSQFQQNLCDLHWTTVKHILKYLRNTKDMFLVYIAYDASKEAVWVRKFISRMVAVLTIKEPIKIYCDNTGAIAIANELGITKGARHFCANVHYLREEAVWVRKFISRLVAVLTIKEPIKIYCDNTGAIAIANELGITKGARHFCANVHYLREGPSPCVSGSPEPRYGRSESPRKRDLERKMVFKRLEKSVLYRLGDKGKTISAYSSDSRHHSTEVLSPWVCEETNPFTPHIRYFDLPERTCMPSHVKTYDGSEDPKDHLKIFQAAAVE
nr:hypothetical protein [Tanacetum cinerariifolium]